MISMKILQTKNRKAVSPVIATLLLVAIAVIGGALIFAFAQGYFTSSQISGRPAIEQFEINGYDASDTAAPLGHDEVTKITGVNTAGGLKSGDVITVWLENKSPQKVTITNLLLAGTVYNFTSATLPTPITGLSTGDYVGIDDLPDDPTLNSSADTSVQMEPGEQITIAIRMAENIADGRDIQLKLTSGNGAVLVGTIVAGQQEG